MCHWVLWLQHRRLDEPLHLQCQNGGIRAPGRSQTSENVQTRGEERAATIFNGPVAEEEAMTLPH